MRKACVKWTEARRFIGGSGFDQGLLSMLKLKGKTTFGSSPMEMLLPGICGRTVSRIIAILNKMRPIVDAVRVKNVRMTAPEVFTKIHALFSITGDIPLKKRKKRCP